MISQFSSDFLVSAAIRDEEDFISDAYDGNVLKRFPNIKSSGG